LQRSFETFDDIAQSLPHWADALYGGLLKQVQLTHAQAAVKETEKELPQESSQESGESA
jgi:hypothetical protein